MTNNFSYHRHVSVTLVGCLLLGTTACTVSMDEGQSVAPLVEATVRYGFERALGCTYVEYAGQAGGMSVRSTNAIQAFAVELMLNKQTGTTTQLMQTLKERVQEYFQEWQSRPDGLLALDVLSGSITSLTALVKAPEERFPSPIGKPLVEGCFYSDLVKEGLLLPRIKVSYSIREILPHNQNSSNIARCVIGEEADSTRYAYSIGRRVISLQFPIAAVQINGDVRCYIAVMPRLEGDSE